VKGEKSALVVHQKKGGRSRPFRQKKGSNERRGGKGGGEEEWLLPNPDCPYFLQGIARGYWEASLPSSAWGGKSLGMRGEKGYSPHPLSLRGDVLPRKKKEGKGWEIYSKSIPLSFSLRDKISFFSQGSESDHLSAGFHTSR